MKPPPSIQLFDLTADPGETRNLAEERPVLRRYCEIHLGTGLAIPRKSQRLEAISTATRFESVRGTISPELKRELEALGYFVN